MARINHDLGLIQQIKNQILSIFPNAEIILFGSRAKKEMTKDSLIQLIGEQNYLFPTKSINFKK